MIDFDDEPDQEKRIEKLKAQLETLGGQPFRSFRAVG